MVRRRLPLPAPRAGFDGSQVSFAMRCGRRTVASLLCAALAAAACGRKGPPLPPLVRIPVPVSSLEARRVGADVYLTFAVPARNVDSSEPPDVSRLDVFALTARQVPTRERVRDAGTRIASVTVPPPGPPGEPAGETKPGTIGAGSPVTVREALGPDQLAPVPLSEDRPAAPAAASPPADEKETPAADGEPHRYYLVIAVSARDRSAPGGAMVSVPVAPPPAPPAGLTVSSSADATVLEWAATPGATGYNVYRGAAGAPPAPADVRPPQPLNASLLGEPGFSEPVAFGERRCYLVRAVREVDGTRVEGDAAADCHTAVDTFPPARPTDLRVFATAGGVALRWQANADNDLAGYLILRGSPGDATLLRITPEPIAGTQFTDPSATSGVRYAYAVVAVDTQGNQSAPSERDQATAQ